MSSRISDIAMGSILNALGSQSLVCILASRMFFNLKEAAEHGVNVGTNWASYTHSAIRFEEGKGRYALNAGPRFSV